MAIKKLQNNFTTPEQSKRLLELGVPADSADCYLLRTHTKGDTFIVEVLHDELYSKKDKFTNMLEYLPENKKGGFFYERRKLIFQ